MILFYIALAVNGNDILVNNKISLSLRIFFSTLLYSSSRIHKYINIDLYMDLYYILQRLSRSNWMAGWGAQAKSIKRHKNKLLATRVCVQVCVLFSKKININTRIDSGVVIIIIISMRYHFVTSIRVVIAILTIRQWLCC